MKLLAIWVSFSRDSEILLESVNHFKSSNPSAVCAVIDDSNNPVEASVKSALAQDGVVWVSRDTARENLNLRGMAWITEQLECSIDIAEDNECDAVLKIDSDTIVLNVAPAISAIDQGKVAYGAENSADHTLYGASYCVSLVALKAVLAEIETLPVYCFDPSMFPQGDIGEDTFISKMLFHLYGSEAISSVPLNKQSGWLSSYAYGNSQVTLAEYANRFDCVTFGDRRLTNPAEQLATMQQFVTYAEL